MTAACTSEGISVEVFCDRISHAVALRYANGLYTFDYCDGVVNALYSYMLFHHKMVPPPFSMSVFLAFDEGEYHHTGDSRDVSPEERYTRPRITELLAGFRPVEPPTNSQ
ncbi:MAG: hypothetical protein FJ304_17070 [Planctomycetes bacterium]|nr:hypothetical protein [Planctomycetota bacterium]